MTVEPFDLFDGLAILIGAMLLIWTIVGFRSNRMTPLSPVHLFAKTLRFKRPFNRSDQPTGFFVATIWNSLVVLIFVSMPFLKHSLP